MDDPVVIGALVGGGIAIVTTVANLAFNWFRGKAERQFNIKQSVYLEACEWAARGTEYLASFARLDLDDAQLGQIMQSGTSAYYRVHVVARQPTVVAFTAASEYLASQSLELMTTRVQLRQRATRLSVLQSEAEQTSAYLTQTASIIDSLPKAAPSANLLAAIPQMVAEFTAARDRLQETQAEIRTLQDELVGLQEQLFATCLQASVGYGECLLAANLSARKELGMPLDEEEYRKSVQAASRRTLGAVEQMIEKFKQDSATA